MIAIWALLAFIGTIVVPSAVLGRHISEAKSVGFVVVGLFAGRDALEYMRDGLVESIQAGITFAALAFILMSFVLA